MSTPERRHYTPVAKVAILRKHLLEAQPISEVCSEAYLLKESFGQLWDYHSPAWARKFFDQWW